MVTLSHLYIKTDATKLAIFKLSDWIGLIYWTHILQCETQERHAQYFDSFVCSGKSKVKVNSLIYCSTFSVFFTIFTPLSFQVKSQTNLYFNYKKSMANSLVRHICPRIRINSVHNTIVHAFKNVLATRKSSTNMVNLSERESKSDHLATRNTMSQKASR